MSNHSNMIGIILKNLFMIHDIRHNIQFASKSECSVSHDTVPLEHRGLDHRGQYLCNVTLITIRLLYILLSQFLDSFALCFLEKSKMNYQQNKTILGLKLVKVS